MKGGLKIAKDKIILDLEPEELVSEYEVRMERFANFITEMYEKYMDKIKIDIDK